MTKKKDTTIFNFSVGQAISAFVGTVIVTSVSTVFVMLNTGINDHFTIVANSDRIEDLEANTVSRGEFVAVSTRLERIENKIDCILSAVNCR